MEFAEQRFFLSEWAVNLSPGGMFVRSEAPILPGQRFHFDAGLTAKGPRFEGVGEVMWVRRDWEGNARPPGFAVRFLELQQDGVDAMQRLADVFLDKGVGAMQEELAAMAAAWHRRHLDEESTDELQPVEEVPTPLPDTAVIQAPWLGGDEPVTAPIAQVAAAPPAGEEATPAAGLEREITAPLAVEPPASPALSDEAPKPPGRRRVWWVGGVALLLAGSAYLVLQGPLAGRLSGAPAPDGAAEAMLAAAPRAMPVAARGPVRPASFGGLDGVRWSEDAAGLWVELDLDGVLPPESVHRMRFEEDHPREVIRLVGARHGYTPAVTPVGSPLLERIRVGFHPAYDGTGPAGDELRVVLDLTSAAVVARQVLAGADGRSLRVLLVREEPEAPAAAGSAAAPAQ